jgi:hypothetical protein
MNLRCRSAKHKIISFLGDASVRPTTGFNSRITGWSQINTAAGVPTLEDEARILFKLKQSFHYFLGEKNHCVHNRFLV